MIVVAVKGLLACTAWLAHFLHHPKELWVRATLDTMRTKLGA